MSESKSERFEPEWKRHDGNGGPIGKDWSSGRLLYAHGDEEGVGLSRLGLRGYRRLSCDWRNSEDFIVQCEGIRVGSQSRSRRLIDSRMNVSEQGAKHYTVRLRCDQPMIEIECHTVIYEEEPIYERWITVCNVSGSMLRLERFDPLQLELSEGEWRVLTYRSDWGAEFEPEEWRMEDSFTAETRWGRSSKGMHPWVTLVREDGAILHVSPMWSGNWAVRTERREDGGIAVCAGVNDWAFAKDLMPGETLESPRIAIAVGCQGDLHTISIPLARIGRKYWYPQGELTGQLPIEWNHWYSYEDKQIDSAAFKANADEAAMLGFEACTLDAGWFGGCGSSSHWYDIRGDWNMVNEARFPEGIREISDHVRGLGMRFGLWCEIEGLGAKALLSRQRPSLPALREGEALGYVCFGNPEAQTWAFEEIDRLIQTFRCQWLKLDFNVDPHAGCDRHDHGHGKGDGLYEHVKGLYDVLKRLREAHPDVLFENCSSGGLRLDLGMARHTHVSFLSDPDWPEHSLQVFWGASTFLAPDRALKWSYSDWIGSHPRQNFDPHDVELTLKRFDYYTRLGMLGSFGVSQRLPELPDRIASRLAWLIEQYKTIVRRFIRQGDLYRLTEQPLREGRGSRWAAFQYAMPDNEEHLLFVFRLDGDEKQRRIVLRALDADALYMLNDLDYGDTRLATGADLMDEGLIFQDYEEEQSGLFVLRKVNTSHERRDR